MSELHRITLDPANAAIHVGDLGMRAEADAAIWQCTMASTSAVVTPIRGERTVSLGCSIVAMAQILHIAPVTAFHPDMNALCAESVAEDFRFVDKLIREWHSGQNQFDRSGEILVAAFRSDRIVGICGLSRDFYDDRYGVGRLRHLYVRRVMRRGGIGSALVRFIIDAADNNFTMIRLRTETQDAAEFYARHGFEPVENATATHIRVLCPSAQTS